MTKISHRLVGYDRNSGELIVEYYIPDARLEYAKRTAGIGSDDPQAVLCYKLTQHQTSDIARAIGAAIDAEALNFYMEGVATSGQ